MSRKKVYIAYTGGTIGMKESSSGYIPEKGYLQSYLAAKRVLDDPAMPSFDICEYDPLLDSANMGSEHWDTIARDIADHYQDYDGFIVIHGTDTMAYTASALPFLLQGLAKPVVVTGSQIPLHKTRNDGYENLIASLMVAAHHQIPEVILLFGSRILRGCRAVKVDAFGLEAFDSPNFPALGHIGINIELHKEYIQTAQNIPFHVQSLKKQHVGILRLFPGITADYARNVLRAPLQGVVLETFGQGNAPDNNKALIGALKEAADRGVVIVNITQCLRGTVNQKTYAAGQILEDIGVIGGLDMTPNAALVKMYYLLSQDFSMQEIYNKMRQSLCGELTSVISL
ncbi:asparaginase [bacterium]|nr:asparaginase [bacterium]